jgi:predicted GIY-YIG superfamily endonuclease
MLLCADGSYYVGHTDNLEKRLYEHQNPLFDIYTASRLPVKLVFHQQFDSRDEAFAMERRVKKWSRMKKLALINKDFEMISLFAKKQFRL